MGESLDNEKKQKIPSFAKVSSNNLSLKLLDFVHVAEPPNGAFLGNRRGQVC